VDVNRGKGGCVAWLAWNELGQITYVGGSFGIILSLALQPTQSGWLS
jgi:hypothetical protein